MFTVSSLTFPREQCSPARGEKEKPICPQQGGAGHELGLPGAVSVLVFAAVNVCRERPAAALEVGALEMNDV